MKSARLLRLSGFALLGGIALVSATIVTGKPRSPRRDAAGKRVPPHRDSPQKLTPRAPWHVKEAEIRSFETSVESNSWWLNQLVFRYRSGDDPSGLLDFEESLEKLDRDAIQEAARAYFNTENYIQVTLLPEEKKK